MATPDHDMFVWSDTLREGVCVDCGARRSFEQLQYAMWRKCITRNPVAKWKGPPSAVCTGSIPVGVSDGNP